MDAQAQVSENLIRTNTRHIGSQDLVDAALFLFLLSAFLLIGAGVIGISTCLDSEREEL